MPNTPCTFRQRDVTRALKAGTAAGLSIARYEVDQDRRIIIFLGDPVAPTCDDDVEGDAWKDLEP